MYLGVCAAMWFLQDKLIFPGASSQGQKYAIVLPSPAYELIELRTGDGDKTFAVFCAATDEMRRPRPDAALRPTLIYFYGNGDHLAHAVGAAQFFRAMGVNVLAVEYVGYGMASGRPSERAMYAVADAAYEHLLARGDVNKDKIVPTGSSLGCAAAIELAARRPCAAIVCFSPFTSLPAMARDVAPWLPTRLLLSYEFDNLAKIGKFDGPVFLSHGRADTVVPYHMSERLLKVIRGPVTFVPLEGAGHNDLFEVGADDLRDRLRAFLDRL
jgi:fermentation-respiration switch protein FrsA (DUF1100 family)